VFSEDYTHAGYYKVTIKATFNDKRLSTGLADVAVTSVSDDSVLNTNTLKKENFELLLIDPCWETFIIRQDGTMQLSGANDRKPNFNVFGDATKFMILMKTSVKYKTDAVPNVLEDTKV